MDVSVTIHMAKSEAIAAKLCEVLTQEGYFVKAKPVYKNLASHDNYYEIVVLKSEAEEARAFLMEKGLLA